MLCSIALSLLKGLTQKHMREIYDVYASAEEAFADLGRQYPPLSQALASGKNAAMDLAEKGKTQALIVNEQGKLLKAQRQLGALVYSLAKGKEENK